MAPTSPGIAELGAYIGRRADYKRKLTLERVDSVMLDGGVMIRGNRLPVAGRVQLRAGMQVPVAWRDGKMQVVLYGTGRRTGPTGVTVSAIPVPVAEEVITAPSGEFFFRDQTNFVALDVATAAAAAGMDDLFGVGWGVGDPSYVVLRGGNLAGDSIVAVTRINRPSKARRFPKVSKAKLALVRAYNLTTLGHSFGSITLTHTAATVNTFVLPITYGGTLQEPSHNESAEIEVATSRFYVAPNGDLIALINCRASVTGSGIDGLTFALGSKLVNVTRGGTVLANHVLDSGAGAVFSSPTPSSSPSCGQVGTVTVAVSTGVGTAASGTIEAVLSLKETDPRREGTFNNYALTKPAYGENGGVSIQPSTPSAFLFCGPPRPDLTLAVVGRFAQPLEVLKGGTGGPSVVELARVQGGGAAVLWGVTTSIAVKRLKIADLQRELISVLKGNAELVFGQTVAPLTVERPAARVLFLGKDGDLAYSPRDLTAPFTRQFYWRGRSQSGAWAIDLGTPRKRSELQSVAKRAAPKTPAQKDAVLDGGGDLQVFQEGSS